MLKGYVISADDQFSADGNVVYTVNAVNVVRASNQASLAGAEPSQTLTAGALSYALDLNQKQARIQLVGVLVHVTSRPLVMASAPLPLP